MKKVSYTFLLAIFSLGFFTNCGSDDSPNTEEPSATLEQEREASVAILTGGNNGVWRISEANLVNTSGTFNISNSFNVVDDEFIFSGTLQAGMLQWRQGNAINIEATSVQETLLDYYKSPENTNFLFIGNTNNELNSFDGRFKYIIVDSETINLTITYDNAERLILTLVQKQPSDYMSIPSNGLNFTEVFTFESDGVSLRAPGMIGSYSDNSLFFVTQDGDFVGNGNLEREHIIKWYIDTGDKQDKFFDNEDLVSKQLHIINNRLVIIGGRYINTYPVDLVGVPSSTTHGLEITRFGMAVNNDDAYIVGGDIDDDNLPNYLGEKIYKWNLVNESLEFVADLPEDRYGARSTIVNDKLYVFGGTAEKFINYMPENSIYIYDLVNGTTTSEQMLTGADYTFVDKSQNMIYVAGYFIYDDINGIPKVDFILGSYDTQTGTYQEVTNNLVNIDGLHAIHGMCVFNNKMYIIYGSNGGGNTTWQIMAADLN